MRRLVVPLASSLAAFAFLCGNASADDWTNFTDAGDAMCGWAANHLSIGTKAVDACNYLQYHDNNENTSSPLAAWQMSQAIAATLAVTSNANSPTYTADFIKILDKYANNCGSSSCSYIYGLDPFTSSSDGTTTMYDDNAWLGQDLVQAYHQQGGGSTSAESDAEDLYRFEQGGEWDANGNNDGQHCQATNGSNCYPGGEWFSTARWNGNSGDGNRNIQATGGAGLLANQIYQIDPAGKPNSLSWGENLLDWTKNTLGGGNGWPSGVPDLFSPAVDIQGIIQSHPGDDYGESLYMAQDATLYNLCTGGATVEHACSNYLTNGENTLQAELNQKSLTDMENTCPAFNAIFFYNAQKLVNALGTSDSTTQAFETRWNNYNSYLNGNIGSNGEWNGGSYPNACDAPLPIAGAVRSLMANATGQ